MDRGYSAPPHDAKKIVDDLGGPAGLIYLIANSPYHRKTDSVPSEKNVYSWLDVGIIPPYILMRIVLAYHARYGTHWDLNRYFYRVGDTRKQRPPARYVYNKGRRLLKESIANPMTGVLK